MVVKISILFFWVLTPYGILGGYQERSVHINRVSCVSPANMVNMNAPPLTATNVSEQRIAIIF
jgi:hypothetical protein